MRFTKLKVILICLLIINCFSINQLIVLGNINYKKYQAVVLGKIINEKIKKSGNTYLTEYKIKVKKWLVKKPFVKETRFVRIRVLGAELKDAGIVIKASTTPEHIPINKEVIFLLEQTKLKQKHIFTLSKDGILPNSRSSLLSLRQIKKLFEEIKEI